MWKWSLLALGLGLLFAVLAWSGLRRRSSWRDGEKLWGQVMGVSVTPAWNGADSMDGDRSPARVTLRLSLEGREVSLQKDFPKVLAAPALGQRVRVLYCRSTGEWALWKDIRSWCVLWAILAATAVAVFLLLLLGGRTVAAQLSDYTVDHPNPAGSGLALLVGFGAGATGAALAWGLFLPVLRDAFRPLPGRPAPYWASGSRAKPNLWAGCMSPTGTAGSVPTPCSPWGKARTFSRPSQSKSVSRRGISSPFTKASRAVSPWSRNLSITCSSPSRWCRFSLWGCSSSAFW